MGSYILEHPGPLPLEPGERLLNGLSDMRTRHPIEAVIGLEGLIFRSLRQGREHPRNRPPVR